MRAATLARTGPALVLLDDVEGATVVPPRDGADVLVVFRGMRVPVSVDAQVLPLVPPPRVRK